MNKAGTQAVLSVLALRLTELLEPVSRGAMPAENRFKLYVHCANMYCKHGGELPIAELLTQYGDVTLGDLQDKLTCSECGRREFAVSLLWRV